MKLQGAITKKYIILCSILLLPSSAHALVIDQVNPFDGTSIEAGINDVWHQQIVAGASGYLAGIDLWWHIPWKPNKGRNNIFDVGVNGYMRTATLYAQDTWNFIDLRGANLYLDYGDVFYLDIQNTYDNTSLGGSWFNQYAAGKLFLNDDTQEYTIGLLDFAFRTHVNPVPEPATMLLFGTGLAGLAGFRKKFKKK